MKFRMVPEVYEWVQDRPAGEKGEPQSWLRALVEGIFTGQLLVVDATTWKPVPRFAGPQPDPAPPEPGAKPSWWVPRPKE